MLAPRKKTQGCFKNIALRSFYTLVHTHTFTDLGLMGKYTLGIATVQVPFFFLVRPAKIK